MDTIGIRKYKADDYNEVNRLFVLSVKDYIKNGIIGGMKTPKISAGLIFLFFLGFIFSSLYHGIIACFIGICFHAACVILVYAMYLWFAKRTDMKDKSLKFWTTPPNIFLVATAPILPNVILGCISYKEKNPTTVEMNRLVVDSEFRGMKIGRKLVQSLIDVAKENGYETMYLATSGPYGTKWNALYLYEKMNFKYLRSMGFGWPGCIIGCFTSIRVVSYIYRIE